MTTLQRIKNIGHFVNAVLAATYYGYPGKKLTIIGVTGTDGKTTTSTICYHLLKADKRKVALVSTVAAYIGDESLDTGFHVTSPTPWALQKLLKKIREGGFEYVVLEATSHGLDQHRLYGVDFDIGVLTNITHEHLDYHGSYALYVKAKSKLFQHVSFAILNKDDGSFVKVKKYIPSKATLVAYSHKDITAAIRKRFPEEYNQLNAVAAMQAAMALGVKPEVITSAIADFPGVEGRMERIENNRGMHTIVDFAHTPNGLEQALKALKANSKGKIIAIYGAAGLRDVEKRPLMGEIGARLADYVILTSEDPRVEQVHSIIYQMKQGVKENHQGVITITDRQEAINFAINSLANKGDTVVVFGKGHEKSLNLDGAHETPWSDQKAMRQALAS